MEAARVIILDKSLVLAAVLSDALEFAPLAVIARQVDRVDGGARGVAHFAHHERVGVGAVVFLLFGSGIDDLEGAAAKLLPAARVRRTEAGPGERGASYLAVARQSRLVPREKRKKKKKKRRKKKR